MAQKRTEKLVASLSTKKPSKRRKKTVSGKPIKEKDNKQAAAEEKLSARELAVNQAKKQGASIDEQNRLKGRNPKRTRKPKGKALPKGGAKVQTSRLFGKSRKKSKKSTTKTKKAVAKSKPRTYSNSPSAVRSRQYREKKRMEQEARALFRGTVTQAPRRSRSK